MKCDRFHCNGIPVERWRSTHWGGIVLLCICHHNLVASEKPYGWEYEGPTAFDHSINPPTLREGKR